VRRTYPPTNRALLVWLAVIAVIAEGAALLVTRYALNWSWPFVLWLCCTGAVALVISTYRQYRR
jgi:hypothetical protein